MILMKFFGWLSPWDLIGIAVVVLIFRKKITAWLKSLFAKKQPETTDTES